MLDKSTNSISFYSFGPGPIPWFIASELVPQHYRGYVVMLSQVINNLVILILTYATFPLFEAIGAWSFLILFVGQLFYTARRFCIQKKK